ncbi:MAG: hypothetical protein QUS35_02230 [bacterium]|nr:hypothetical protein [bacterium]
MRKPGHVIVGIHIRDRIRKAPDMQKILSKHGCVIKTRVGLHEVSENFCDPAGLIILELAGDRQSMDAFVKEVSGIKGVDVKKMTFSHD